MHAVAGHVRHAEVDGCRVILDLDSGEYRILDPIASVMWTVLTGEAPEAETLVHLGLDHGAPIDRIRHDFEAFARLCQAERLLTDNPVVEGRSGSPPQATRPGWFGALRVLISTNSMLARPEGFSKLYALCAGLTVGARAQPLETAVSAFVRAENLYWARRAPDDCLGRSLALYRFLCGCGVKCRHLIGVGRIPFRAHAWVECEGEALLDRRGLSLTPIAVMAPRG